LQIDGMGEALPFLDIEDGAAADRRLAVGDLVLAIGNPFGVGQTVTIGIISALARQAPGISDYAFFIQTDAAINPGNSGGALVDVTGKVVGINTAIFSQDGGSLGIGFAVPARMVEAVIRSVDTNGSIVRPWFGASGKSVTPEIASVLGMSRPAGVLIESVIEGGPAFKAGIRRGDVIEAVAGNDVIGVEGLRFGIATLPLGDEAGLRLRRDGSYLETTFVAMAPPEEPPRNLTNLRGSNPFAGSRIANLSPAVAEEMGLALQSFMGVVIDAVARSSPARRTGLKRGDIIVRLNGKDISTIEDLQLALDDADRRWDVSIRRDGRIITTTISG
ncbi:MAG: PDZ domain-containing protein, partial [Pseudomonadota bacterium]